jgi:hypothetical protein
MQGELRAVLAVFPLGHGTLSVVLRSTYSPQYAKNNPRQSAGQLWQCKILGHGWDINEHG